MMDTKQFEEQVKQFATEWQKRIEDLQVQFSLGKMDTVDAFEKQKENFRGLVVKLKENLDKATDVAEENMKAMKAKLEELQLQLALGKADGTEAFEIQKKKIELALHEVYVAGKNAYSNTFNQTLQLFDNNAQAFKTGLEILKLQFSLGKMDAKDDVQNATKEINEKMSDLNDTIKESIKKVQQQGKDNIEEWNKQMKESYEKMKTFTEGWMKK